MLCLWKENNKLQLYLLTNNSASIYFHFRKEHDNPLASFVRTLVFERIIISYGSGMDPLTGKFTSPVDGVYIFYFSGTAISSTYLQVNSFYENCFQVFQNSIHHKYS